MKGVAAHKGNEFEHDAICTGFANVFPKPVCFDIENGRGMAAILSEAAVRLI